MTPGVGTFWVLRNSSKRSKRSNAQNKFTQQTGNAKIKLYKEGVEEQLTPGVGTTS